MQTTLHRSVEEEVVPAANSLEYADQHPVEIVNRTAELGFFGVLIPQEYGDVGLDSVSYAIALEELARG